MPAAPSEPTGPAGEPRDPQVPTPADSALELVRDRSASLSPAEQRVGRVVLTDPVGVIHLSVTELAAASDTSVGTVIRFCQSLGLRGFQDLKLRLARDSIPAERQILEEVSADDGPEQVARKVLLGTSRAVEEAAQHTDAAMLGRIAEALVAAGRIQFVAVGTSAPLASDIAYRLTTIGLPAYFPADVHAQDVSARMLRPGDVCFAVSHTGSTTETLAAMRTAARSGALTVALTSFSRSPLTELVDLSLIAGSRETSYRIETMTSRIVHLALLDALFVLIALRHPPSRDALAATADVLTEHRI